jgi:hypothetical protein
MPLIETLTPTDAIVDVFGESYADLELEAMTAYKPDHPVLRCEHCGNAVEYLSPQFFTYTYKSESLRL